MGGTCQAEGITTQEMMKKQHGLQQIASYQFKCDKRSLWAMLFQEASTWQGSSRVRECGLPAWALLKLHFRCLSNIKYSWGKLHLFPEALGGFEIAFIMTTWSLRQTRKRGNKTGCFVRSASLPSLQESPTSAQSNKERAARAITASKPGVGNMQHLVKQAAVYMSNAFNFVYCYLVH